MGRMQSCSKGGLNRGAWTKMEDKILKDYVGAHGEGKWSTVPKKAGLNRCGKSCRLRWLNYLRPNIKRGNISEDEEELIIKMHRLLGNRWSLIAGRLPGRTDNEIKNYWNTNAGKKALGRHPASSPGSSCLASSSIPCADQVAKPAVDAQAGEDAIENQGYEERLDEVIHPDVSIPPPPESNVGKDSCPIDLGLLDDHFLSKLLGMDEDAEKDDGGTGGVGWAGVEEKISGASSSMNTEEALMSPEFMILCESDLLSMALFLEDDGDLE